MATRRNLGYIGALIAFAGVIRAQNLDLASGYTSFQSSCFAGKLLKDSQILAQLSPSSNTAFSFTPFDKLSSHTGAGQHLFGDVIFRARVQGSTDWTVGDSAANRQTVKASSVSSSNEIARADMTPTLPDGIPLTVERIWRKEGNCDISVSWVFTNPGQTAVEIGALEFPAVFNNQFTDRTASDTNNKCSLIDPYIGKDAGYVRVVPLLGTQPVLLLTPLQDTSTPLEAWNFLTENSNSGDYQSQTYEGNYAWTTHSLAYTENEWGNVVPWNEPSSATISPGASRTYGLRMTLAAGVKEIDSTLVSLGRPVVRGVPGFSILGDAGAKLFVRASSSISQITAEPSGAISWSQSANVGSYSTYDLTANAFGRARLTLDYSDGLSQTVHYHLANSGPETLQNVGSFIANNQLFEDTSDPFSRAPSIITYDNEVSAQVVQEPRVWIAGLSDEGGAGSWLTFALKQLLQPNTAEVAVLENFVSTTVKNVLQAGGSQVRKSVFYYGKSNFDYSSSYDWGNWWSWDQADAYATDRGYDYVHVVAAHWTLYRLARNYGVTTGTWQSFLSSAVNTVLYLMDADNQVGYTDVGLMGETVFLELLKDLQREGSDWESQYSQVSSAMQARAAAWAGEDFPFGSEMAWDSTGQEGVYTWTDYFNYADKALQTVNSILAYQPGSIPHWGWNGNARRYWDFIYAGKLQNVERMLHHYESSLSALPLLSAFRAGPSDSYLLSTGFAGINGPINNIQSNGFASQAFHSFPNLLHWEAYSGDYGPGFVGHALGTGTYVFQDSDLGLVAYGGALTQSTGGTYTVSPQDTAHKRLFLSSFKVLLTLDAGVWTSASWSSTSRINLQIAAVPASVSGVSGIAKPSVARLVIEGTSAQEVDGSSAFENGAWSIPLSGGSASVQVVF